MPLQSVSPAGRAVLLHSVEDLSIEETAAILDISVGTAKSLRLALNEIDRLRNRCLWMTRFLIAASIAFRCASDVMFLLRGNVAMGMTFALCALMPAIFAVGINQAGTSYALTLKTLEAIKDLSRERSQGPHS